MSNHDDVPSPAAPQPLGTIALGLGIAALFCGAIAGLSWVVPALNASTWLAVLVGIAAVVVGIIAIVKRRARTHAIIGLILAVAAGPVAFLMAFLTTMILLVGHNGFSG
ncbi:hypothetical protein ACI3KT_14070 [Microbacterium sp. ZW T6_19]|uniref:hypothetical protein n=1 Tax=Microbacterium sp. ZW T6_19 TaxID=3378082 RepID=UPI003851F9AD